LCNTKLSQVIDIKKSTRHRFKFWQWIVGLFLIVSVSIISAFIIISIVVYFLSNANVKNLISLDIENPNSVGNFFLLFLSFLPALLSIYVTNKYWHKSNWQNLVSWGCKFNWSKVIKQTFLLFLALAVISVFEILILRGVDSINFLPPYREFFTCFIIILIFCPIQVLTEEVFFRGYLSAFALHFISSKVLVWLLISFIFASFHFVGETSISEELPRFTGLFIIGMTASILSDIRKGLDLSVSYHLSMNIAAFALIGYPSNDMPKSYLFERVSFSVDWVGVFIVLVFSLLTILYYLKYYNK